MIRLPASPATTPPALVEWDPQWSRIVDADCHDGTRSFHVLDTLPALRAAGLEPTGTILALHGNPTWSYLWRRLAQATLDYAVHAAGEQRQVWRVIAPDQLEMGYSQRLAHDSLPAPKTGDYRRIAQRVSDFDAVVTQLLAEGPQSASAAKGEHPVVTIGHDWGGVLSLTWAARNQDRVSGVITLNTAAHQPEGDPIPGPLRAALAGPLLPGSTVFTDAFIRVTLHLTDHLQPQVARAYRAPYATWQKRLGVGSFVADIPVDESHPSYAELQALGRDISQISTPALILWGPKDPVFQERYLRDLLTRIPHAAVHRFEGTSHLLAEDVDYAGTVLTWLADTFPRAQGAAHVTAALQSGAGAEAPSTDAGDLTGRGSADAGAQGPAMIFSTLDSRRNDTSVASVDMTAKYARAVTWEHLSFVVDRIAAGLQAAGLQRGDRVSLLVPPGNDLTAAAYGVLKAGGVAVVADAGLGPRGMTRAVVAADPAWIIGEVPGLTLARASRWPGRRISVRPLDALLKRALGVETSITDFVHAPAGSAAAAGAIDTPTRDDDAAILFTSGSTGPAKGVRYTHRSLAQLAALLAEQFDVRPGTGLVAGFPPFALLGPAIGATSVTPEMEVTKPRTLTAAALADAAQAGDCTMVFASPAAFTNVTATASSLTPEQRAACERITLVLSAGAPVPLALMEDVSRVFPNAQIHSPYGMTEGLLLTDIDSTGVAQAAASGDHGVCVGTPIPGVEVSIAPLLADGGSADTLLAPAQAAGVLGEIVVSAPHILDSYDRLWATARSATRDSTTGAHRHRTNDIGHFDEQGRLWLEGRLQHVITSAGGPLGPASIEAVIDADAAVTRSAAVGVGPVGTQVLVVVLEPGDGVGAKAGAADADVSARLRARVRDELGLDLAAVLVADDFPTDIRHNSKIDRSALRRWADVVLRGGRL